MSEPEFTQFEEEVHDAADEIFWSGKTGYNWDPVDEVLKAHLPIEGQTRCKKATDSGRAANVITESNDKQIELYVVFIGPAYSVERFIPAAVNRVERFPNVKTVAAADLTSGKWRVRALIERHGVNLAEELADSFPAVGLDDIHYVDAEFKPQAKVEPMVPSVPIVDEDEFVSAMMARETETEGMSTMPVALVQFAEERDVILDASLATDLLASTLASQLLLFAGPSGTGKSTMARLLSEFFAPAHRRFRIEASRQWLSAEDLVGYYSVLSRQYATAPDTETIIGMHEASVAQVSDSETGGKGPPILVIEEMNLSAPEGYLAPVIHGLSGIDEPYLRWKLHAGSMEAVDEAAVATLPPAALIGPYPRVFGTINVDASAHAPARKVAARSSIVLLEPITLDQSELAKLARVAKGGAELNENPSGQSFLGDPLTALRVAPDAQIDDLAEALLSVVGEVEQLQVSRRDAIRCLAYMTYFVALAGGDDSEGLTTKLAAENAFLHYLLPMIEPGRFAEVLRELGDAELTEPASSSSELGGLLKVRVDRLHGSAGIDLDIGVSVDFWSALS